MYAFTLIEKTGADDQDYILLIAWHCLSLVFCFVHLPAYEAIE